MARISSGNWLFGAAALALAGCSAQGDPQAVVAGGGTAGPVDTRYDLANRCFLLKADSGYVARDADGYVNTAADADDAERFYMKPAGLGRYLFYGKDATLVTGSTDPVAGGAVAASATPADGSDWTFTETSPGRYNAATLGQSLGVAGGDLVLADAAAELTFEPATGCTTYPEMPIDIGETFTGPQGGELIGYADIHAHMAMGSDMSDGSGDRGPSAGGVMYGHAVDRFGVPEALKNCSAMHGPNGTTSAEIVLDGPENGPDEHNTVGWPSFVDWPARDSMLHQQMYYRFVERSYRAGQRLMVLHGTNIEALCDVAKKTSGDKQSDCSDMGVGLKQVAYAHDIQDYIDAQHGGPGKGWFRIAKDPTEAEAFIRAGKMAVVPGLEFSNIFKCNVTFQPGGDEVVGCTTDIIDQQIEEAWDAGVRGIFLYHDVDSALGGTGIFSEVLNLVNYHGTKGWWKTYTCDDEWTDAEDQGYFYGAGAVMLGMGGDQLGALLDNPIGAALIEGGEGTYPAYPPTKQCNSRFTTALGQYALEAAMKKGFVLDIDHAEIMIKQEMLDEGARTDPAYPMISAHGGHGGFTNAQVLQMLRQGGIMYPGMVNGREYKGFYNKVEAIWNQMNPAEKQKYPIAVGYGADQNGLAGQPGPRGGDGVIPVDYADITLFRGLGWSGRFHGLPAVKVDQLTIPESGKSWNVDEVGVAHYGMVPDVVEQIRLESGGDTKYLEGFYRSADAYVRLWKQTLAASAARPPLVVPDASTLPMYVEHPIDPTTGDPTPP